MSENPTVIPVMAAISGIFYRKPGPDTAPFVEVGSVVKEGQPLCLLETMKVFTKVKAPASGKIVEIIPEDSDPIEKNQVLFKIEK